MARLTLVLPAVVPRQPPNVPQPRLSILALVTSCGLPPGRDWIPAVESPLYLVLLAYRMRRGNVQKNVGKLWTGRGYEWLTRGKGGDKSAGCPHDFLIGVGASACGRVTASIDVGNVRMIIHEICDGRAGGGDADGVFECGGEDGEGNRVP